MIINKIILNNIRSYKNHEIVFPAGSILLAGDVGAGKTTLLLAIEFSLFGLQPGQRGSSLLTNGEDTGSVILEFQTEDNQAIIERILRRTSKGVNQESSFLTINGSREELSVTELKTRVLELLGYPEEFVKKTNLLYRYTVYSPQEEMKEIILEDSESRLNILRHIFGIDKYRRIKENSSVIISKIREQSKIIQGEIKDIEIYKARILELENSISSLDGKLNEKENIFLDKKSIRKKIELELSDIKEKVKEKNKFEKEAEKTSILLTNKSQYLGEHDREVKKLKDKISETKGLFDEFVYREIISSLEKKKKLIESAQTHFVEINERIKSLNSAKTDNMIKRERIFSLDFCPTCLQDVPYTHKHNILNDVDTQIGRAEREAAELSSQLAPLQTTFDKEKKDLIDLEQRKSSMDLLKLKSEESVNSQKRLAELMISREAIDRDIKALEQHLFLLKQSVLEFSKFDILLNMKETELKKAFQEEKNTEINIAEIKKERELTAKEQERARFELAKKEQSRGQLLNLNSLENWLAGDFISLISLIEKNIMLKLREEFSRLFNNWFSMLTTDSFYVHLDENFTPIIMQRDYELDYSFLSGGERTAVALAYRLALNQIINSIHSKIKTRNLIILDEPTDGFSEQQLDKVRDILKEIKAKQLIIVSHEQKIESFVDNVIRIKKESGYSARA